MSDWISVKNKSTPKDRRVLAYTFCINSWNVMVVWHNEEYGFHGMFLYPDGNFWHFIPEEDITHWMPLPDPPNDGD